MTPDYDRTETLTRLMALDQMKKLSEAFQEAKAKGDQEAMYHINVARAAIRDNYMKVVK